MENGQHVKRYDIKAFRVVTVTLTPERALSLNAAAREVLPSHARKHFLFASIDGFSLSNPNPILGDVFVSPWEPDAEGNRHRLVPQAQSTGPE
jgi:hypothetical protein